MIGRTNAVVGEIDKKVEITFTVEGAKGDNITITDASGEIVGNVIFDTDAVSKEYTMMIDDGAEYTFTSSVAKDTETGTSDYSKTVTLTKSTDAIKAMPDGALFWGKNFIVPIRWMGVAPLSVTQRTYYDDTSYSDAINLYSDNGNVNNILQFDISGIEDLTKYSKICIHYKSYTANNSSYNYVSMALYPALIPQNGNYVEANPNYLRTDSSVTYSINGSSLGRIIENSARGTDITFKKSFTQDNIADKVAVGFNDWYMGQNLIDYVWFE